MKKICIAIFVCIMLSVSAIGVNADYIPEDDMHTYETSWGAPCSFEEVVVYIEDFEGVEFESSQEFIDFVYEVGAMRANSRSSHIDILGYQLTPDELELLKDNIDYIPAVVASKEFAVIYTRQYYSETDSEDGRIGNAYQHALWTMLLCNSTDPEFALTFVTAHENYDTNPELHKTMDMYNNQAAYDYFVTNNLESYNFYEAQIAGVVFANMLEGDYIYIVFDYEYTAKVFHYIDTGRVSTIKSTGDFYAYTNSTVPYNVPETVHIYVEDRLPPSPDNPVIRPQNYLNNEGETK